MQNLLAPVAVVSFAALALASPQVTTRSASGGASTPVAPRALVCAEAVRDQATGGCLEASSVPAPGRLFPPPHDGGVGNVASGPQAFVGGGLNNQAAAHRAVIGGGEGNVGYAEYGTIAGGRDNYACCRGAAIGGGRDNDVIATFGTVSGGAFNVAATGYGYGYSTVGGGRSNAALADYSTIAGGRFNTAGPGGFASYDQTVGGGAHNEAAGDSATVAGGAHNTAAVRDSTVGGGCSNTASGQESVVAGGAFNTASGRSATVPGGRQNEATGDYGLAAGRRARANHAGAFVWGDAVDADKTSSDPNQFSVYASGGARIFSNAAATTGVLLAAGGGSWSSVSDRAAKENVEPVDGRAVLARLVELPIATWNYRAQDDAVRHMGPMAQDFRAAFGLGLGDTTIDTVDPDGVALAAIQGLKREKDEELAALRAENEALREWLERLERRLAGD